MKGSGRMVGNMWNEPCLPHPHASHEAVGLLWQPKGETAAHGSHAAHAASRPCWSTTHHAHAHSAHLAHGCTHH